MNRPPRVNPVSVGITTILVMLGVIALVVVSGLPGGPQLPLLTGSHMTLKVRLANADALAPHASVQIAGVKIGEIQSVQSDGDTALVTMNLDKQYGDIHSDAKALLRPHGLFGPKYIELSPGTTNAPVLHDGDVIAATQTVQPVDLDQVLQELNAPEKENLRTAIVELGKAAEGRGQDVNQLVNAANTLTATLDAPVQRLGSVAPNLSDALVQDEAFNASFAQTPLDQLVANSNHTLEALAANSDHLESLLVHANSVLGDLDTALNGQSGSIRKLLEVAPPTIDKLDRFNDLLAVFGANLTGKEPGVSDATAGIIGAIENVRSAFGGSDPCQPGQTCSRDGREHYVRVETFGIAPNPVASLCGSPIPGINVILPCGSTNQSAPAGGGATVVPAAFGYSSPAWDGFGDLLGP